MFLITTAYEKSWQEQDELVLLGEWCKVWSRREYWDKTAHEVVPYRWNDRKKLHEDFLYLDVFYERVLDQLTQKMNLLHNVNHSKRYWRIIVGPWLSSFLCMFYDRYQSIRSAKEFGKITNTLIIKSNPAKYVVKDIPGLIPVRSTDYYNYYLFSQIIEEIKPFPFEYINAPLEANSGERHSGSDRNSSYWKKMKYDFVEYFSQNIPDWLNKVVFVSSYVRPWDLAKLQLSLKQIPYIVSPSVDLPEMSYNAEMRETLFLDDPETEFEKVFSKLFHQHIPMAYIEGYQEIHSKSLAVFPKKPRVIFTAGGYETYEGYKFWAAYHADRGSKLVGTQHGFNYGAIKWFHEEDHQIKCYDKFYTWGWESDEFDSTVPLPAVKFNHNISDLKPNKDGKILLATYAWPRYSYKMLSVPVASEQCQEFIDSQVSIVNLLSKEVRSLVLVRPKAVPVYEEGLNQLDRWAEGCADVETYMGSQISMYDQMSDSRLFVTIVCSTAQLESFSANFPTVLFWSPFHEVRDQAQPFFDDLVKAGILHKTPQSLANKINEIYEDPMSWWLQPDVQKAKDMFCAQYARTSDDWRNIWKTELLSLANSVGN